MLALGGGRSWAERQQRYQQECEATVREGLAENLWERLAAGVALGGPRFVRQLRGHLRSASREQPRLVDLPPRPGLARAVAVVEALKGEGWEEFRERYGDWGRDLVWYLGQQVCRLRLRELAGRVGGVAYKTVATGIRRFKQQCTRDKRLVSFRSRQAEGKLKNGET